MSGLTMGSEGFSEIGARAPGLKGSEKIGQAILFVWGLS